MFTINAGRSSAGVLCAAFAAIETKTERMTVGVQSGAATLIANTNCEKML